MSVFIFIFCGSMSAGPVDGSLAGSALPNAGGGSGGGGSSAPAIPPSNQVIAFEQQRLVNLPTGPSAPAPAGDAAEALVPGGALGV